MGRHLAVPIVVTIMLTSPVAAGEIEDEPFVLRLLLALERAGNFADTLGLHAAAAYAGGASMNPAGGARRARWEPEATLSSVNAFSSSSAWMTAGFGHFGFSPGESDRLSFGYARTSTLDADTRRDLDIEFSSDEFHAGYASALSSDTTLGAEFRFISAFLDEETIPVELGIPVRAQTDMLGPDLTLGLQHAVDDELAVGIMGGFGIQWTRTRVENMVPLPIPDPPGAYLPPGTRLDRIDSRVMFLDLRGGVSYAIDTDVTLLADIQYLHYDIDDLSKADTARLFGGARIRLAGGFHLHLGASVDIEGEVTAGAGAVVALADRVRLSLTYQWNAFPEVHQEFGRFQQITFSLSLEF